MKLCDLSRTRIYNKEENAHFCRFDTFCHPFALFYKKRDYIPTSGRPQVAPTGLSEQGAPQGDRWSQ